MTCQWILIDQMEECGAPALYEEPRSTLQYCGTHAQRLLNHGYQLVPAKREHLPHEAAMHRDTLETLRREFSPRGRTGELQG